MCVWMCICVPVLFVYVHQPQCRACGVTEDCTLGCFWISQVTKHTHTKDVPPYNGYSSLWLMRSQWSFQFFIPGAPQETVCKQSYQNFYWMWSTNVALLYEMSICNQYFQSQFRSRWKKQYHAILCLTLTFASSCSHRRMTRSNSVTTAVQADLDDPADAPELPPRHCATMPRQHSRDAATSTVSIQGSGNHYHACAGDDYGEVGFDPSILPPPDPWMDSMAEPEVEALETVSRTVCPRDGRWFLKLLQAETDRMEGWCRQMKQDEMENELPDESELNHSLDAKMWPKESLLYIDIRSIFFLWFGPCWYSWYWTTIAACCCLRPSGLLRHTVHTYQ